MDAESDAYVIQCKERGTLSLKELETLALEIERVGFQRPSPKLGIVIVCMRAKYPMQEDKVKREWVRSDRLEPKQSEDILFEMFAHGWIDREHKFRGTKYTRPDWRGILKDGEPITLETGQRLAEWSRDPTRPTSPPDEIACDRAARLSVCKEIAREQKWTRAQWATAWTKACGEATESNVDPSALADLERAITGTSA